MFVLLPITFAQIAPFQNSFWLGYLHQCKENATFSINNDRKTVKINVDKQTLEYTRKRSKCKNDFFGLVVPVHYKIFVISYYRKPFIYMG